MATPTLSLCLPVYNGQRYLADAVGSLLRQTFSDFELLIVDNASTDNTETVARELAAGDARVRYVRNEKNLGAAPNFNRAFELSRGRLIRWASHDDLWSADAMQVCIEALERDPAAVACHGRTVVVDEAGEEIPTYDATRQRPPSERHLPAHRLYDPADRRLDSPVASERLADLLLRTHWCYEIFGVIRREALQRSSLHGSYYGSDKVLLAELLMAGRMITVPQTVFYRRDHTGNSTSLRTQTERAEWMDTSLKGRIRRPHLTLLNGYRRAIWRSGLGLGEKLSCSRVLLAWMLQLRKIKTVIAESDSASTGPQAVSAHS